MTDVQNCFISLIRNVVVGAELPANFKVCDLADLYKLSKKQDMAHIIAYGLKKNTLIDLGSDLWKKYYNKQYSLAQFRVANLDHECEKVCSVLEEAGIDHLPLKGAVIRRLYPESWMRISCDIDILVHEEDIRKAETVLIEKLRCKVKSDGYLHGHDDQIRTPNGFVIELHFILSESKDKALSCLNDIWDYVSVVDGKKYQYRMNDEMFYLYHIYHASKHFRYGGCGVKTVLDTWVINHKLGLNSANCGDLIEQSGLLKFAKMIESISEKWFSGIDNDDYIDLEEYIFSGGVYGSGNHVSAKQTRADSKRLKYTFQRAFPPYSFMCERYCQLRGKPLLLPYYWFKRLVAAFGKQNSKRTKAEIKTAWLEKEKSKKIKAMFDELGL